MWDKTRLCVYVTLLPNSNLAEWYVVGNDANGRSDLLSDGLSPLSKVGSDLASSFTELFGPRAQG